MNLNSRQISLLCARVCREKKATNIVILDLRHLRHITDYFVICSVEVSKQGQAIVDEIGHQMKGRGITGLSVSGYQTGNWIVLDTGPVIVHIFDHGRRDFYNIEDLWGDAKKIRVAKAVRKRARTRKK